MKIDILVVHREDFTLDYIQKYWSNSTPVRYKFESDHIIVDEKWDNEDLLETLVDEYRVVNLYQKKTPTNPTQHQTEVGRVYYSSSISGTLIYEGTEYEYTFIILSGRRSSQ
ncbi:hypothetical protein CEW46_31195 [Bacillus cereus]|nr:hypothetical protein CEW46_31195 [Bacillus cereus]